MLPPVLKGRVAFIFEEENFDIDQIVGVKNIKVQDSDELASLAMKDFDPAFGRLTRPGDLLVGGSNFGYGHPHYPPMIAMRRLGIAGVIAESFSPGYWRGEISMGFPQICCPGICRLVERWDPLEVDLENYSVKNLSNGRRLSCQPLSAADRAMLSAGGLINYLKQREINSNKQPECK